MNNNDINLLCEIIDIEKYILVDFGTFRINEDIPKDTKEQIRYVLDLNQYEKRLDIENIKFFYLSDGTNHRKIVYFNTFHVNEIIDKNKKYVQTKKITFI